VVGPAGVVGQIRWLGVQQFDFDATFDSRRHVRRFERDWHELARCRHRHSTAFAGQLAPTVHHVGVDASLGTLPYGYAGSWLAARRKGCIDTR
jgi:hypothetical protein